MTTASNHHRPLYQCYIGNVVFNEFDNDGVTTILTMQELETCQTRLELQVFFFFIPLQVGLSTVNIILSVTVPLFYPIGYHWIE